MNFGTRFLGSVGIVSGRDPSRSGRVGVGESGRQPETLKEAPLPMFPRLIPGGI